jgi:hypothetical protein
MLMMQISYDFKSCHGFMTGFFIALGMSAQKMYGWLKASIVPSHGPVPYHVTGKEKEVSAKGLSTIPNITPITVNAMAEGFIILNYRKCTNRLRRISVPSYGSV